MRRCWRKREKKKKKGGERKRSGEGKMDETRAAGEMEERRRRRAERAEEMRENKGEGREKIKETGRQPDTCDQIYIRTVQLQNEPDAPCKPGAKSETRQTERKKSGCVHGTDKR